MVFPTIHTQNDDLNRIQANVSKAFQAAASGSVTVVTSNNWAINSSSDKIVQFDTTAINGISASNPLVLVLPDAKTCNGFQFIYKKVDSSGNKFQFVTTGLNKQGKAQTIEGQPSPYSSTASLAAGTLYSDGNNWWIK